jgi:hypothetical protein
VTSGIISVTSGWNSAPISRDGANRPALIREARIDRGSVYDGGCTKTFFQLLTPALIVTATNFVWFALVFWGFLVTKPMISTSTLARHDESEAGRPRRRKP